MENKAIITHEFLGRRCLFRDGKKLREGVIQEISPDSNFIRMNQATWVPNQPGIVVTLLPDSELKTDLPDPRRNHASA